MNSPSMKKAAVRLGGWGALTGVSVLLTLLFSVLGNLTCAVVAGLILGSGRRWQWNAVPVSLIFPAVVLALSYYSHVELPPAKVYLLALVSLGAFWGVLGLTFGLRFLERKGESPPRAVAGSASIQRTEAPPTLPFNLAALEGCWTCEGTGTGGTLRTKTLRIQDGKFVLTERRLRSREQVMARGDLSLSQTGTGELVFTPKPPPDLER